MGSDFEVPARRSGQHAPDHHGWQQDDRRPVMQLDSERGARHRARQHLAFSADVEEPGAEGQRYRDAGGDERDREYDRVSDLEGGILVLGAGDTEAAAEEA